MSFEEIATHDCIGWDIDGTLINSVASERIRDFILAHPTKRHCLVTFRTHDLVTYMERDLAIGGYPDIDIFDKILTVPANIWMDWAARQTERNKVKKLLLPDICYMEWKGFACKTEGLTVLIDDDVINTQRGCTRYGVKLIDTSVL